MKKRLSILPFILACCLLIGVIGWGISGIYDISRAIQWLEEQPAPSGVDFLGLHGAVFIYGVGVFLISLGGLIVSWISRKVVKYEKLGRISGVLMLLFGLLLLLSVGLYLFSSL
jgi:hypothetical protein